MTDCITSTATSMNWRYKIGKFGDNMLNIFLRQHPLGSRYFPNGIIYPFDIVRLYKNRGQEVRIVFDVGANVGQTSRYLAPWFPNARIFAFEPVDSTFQSLTKNTRNIKSIQCFNWAFGSKEETREIAIKTDCEQNSLIETEASLNSSIKEKVHVKRIDDFCEKNKIEKIDLLKLDVEGFEIEALKGAEKMVGSGNVHFIYAETYFRWENKNMTHFVDIHRYLYDRGYLLSGFYELCRHWDNKLLTCFCNTLYVNSQFKH